MKTKITTMVLAVLTIFSLSGCQPTPEEEFIVKKDTDRMVEQAQDEDHGTAASDLQLPEGNYIFSTTGADGKLIINMDAPIITPSQNIPIVRVTATDFTQEQVSRIFDTLCGNTEMWNVRTGTQYTKSELEEIIMNLKQIASSTDSQSEVEQMNSSIARFKELYQSAPETIVDTRCFGELSESIHVDMNTGEVLSRSYGVNAESRTAPLTTFLVTSMMNESNNPLPSGQVSAVTSNYVRIAYRNNRTNLLLDAQSEPCLKQETQLPESIRQLLSLTPDEAVQKANELLAAFGMDSDFAVSSIYLNLAV